MKDVNNESGKTRIEEVSIDTIYTFAMEAERDSIKTVLLINSGATIAILAFLGALANSKFSSNIGVFSISLALFTCGVISAGFAYQNSLLVNIYRFNTTQRINVITKQNNISIQEALDKKEISSIRTGEEDNVKKLDKYRGASYVLFVLGSIYTLIAIVCSTC